MTLIKSISGFRGTIGGEPGNNLTPVDAVELSAAYGMWLLEQNKGKKVVLGRDARLSGKMISSIVANTLVGLGFEILDLGLSTTPTVEVAVPELGAAGGIILTASHNPKQWNALKLLNEKGEFISAAQGKQLLEKIEKKELRFAEVDDLGVYHKAKGWIDKHIDMIMTRPEVNADLVKKAGLKVVVDAVNSTGGLAIPPLLKRLGIEDAELMYCDPTGHFPHNPEPLAENLTEISAKVRALGADLGIVVDPDVDRLCFVMENGEMFGEEYTLVAVSDYLLGLKNGNAVSNLSSTRALRDVCEKHNGRYSASAVGEVNVVDKMKEVNAVIGGEGNGGIIWPELHYGRDALAGIALFLTFLAREECSMTELKARYPQYYMSKKKLQLTDELDLDSVYAKVAGHFAKEAQSRIDGLKVDLADSWVHLRPSNTEPIVRVYSEALSQEAADKLADDVIALASGN